MKSCPQKKYKFPQKNWISLLNSAGIKLKNSVNPTYNNLYHYAGNNPIKYTDPDGRMQKLPDGSLKVTSTGITFNIQIENNAGKFVREFEVVYLYTDDNKKVLAFKNLTNNTTDFYGEVLTDGQYSLSLDVGEKNKKELKKKIGYDPETSIKTIIESEWEITTKENASIALPKEYNKGTASKVEKEKYLYFFYKYFLVTRWSDNISKREMTKQEEAYLDFYKRKDGNE